MDIQDFKDWLRWQISQEQSHGLRRAERVRERDVGRDFHGVTPPQLPGQQGFNTTTGFGWGMDPTEVAPRPTVVPDPNPVPSQGSFQGMGIELSPIARALQEFIDGQPGHVVSRREFQEALNKRSRSKVGVKKKK